MQGTWVPLLDYASRYNVSLSTLRRQIKINKIQHRMERGRYLVWDVYPEKSQTGRGEIAESAWLRRELIRLESELGRAREEIAELKTLIAFYEDETTPERDH